MTKFIVSIFLIFSCQSLYGCSCLFEKNPEKTDIEIQIDQHDWIAVGRIIEEKKERWEVKYKLEVRKIYKGENFEMQSLVSSLSNCGYSFENNIEYLVYGKMNRNGEVEVSYCSRTTKINETADLTLLNHYLKGEIYPNELSVEETLFLAKIIKNENIRVQNVQLFYSKNKLLTKKEFFSLNPVYTNYEFRKLSSSQLKKVNPKIRVEAENGILITKFGYAPKRIKTRKIIRRINKFLKLN